MEQVLYSLRDDVLFKRVRVKRFKEYEMVYKWIHPQYDPTKFTSPFDIAIIAFKDNDNYFMLSAQIRISFIVISCVYIS